MAAPIRSSKLPRAALYLAIAAGTLIGVGLAVGLVGAIVAVEWRPLGLITSGGGLLALAVAPLVAIAAVVAGHLSRRLYPSDAKGRIALVVGYLILGVMAILVIIGWLTWLSIR